jgi:hypothetical protein
MTLRWACQLINGSYLLKNPTESLALFSTLEPPRVIGTKPGILTPIVVKPRWMTCCQDRRLKGVIFPVHYATDPTRLINEDIGKVRIIMHKNDSEERRRNDLQQGMNVGLECVENGCSTPSAAAIFANKFRIPFSRE